MYNLFKGKNKQPQLRRSSNTANGATSRPNMTLGGGSISDGSGRSTSSSILRGGSSNNSRGSLARPQGVPVTPAAVSTIGGGRPGQVLLQRPATAAPVQQQTAAVTTTTTTMTDQQTQGVISMEEGTFILFAAA